MREPTMEQLLAAALRVWWAKELLAHRLLYVNVAATDPSALEVNRALGAMDDILRGWGA